MRQWCDRAVAPLPLGGYNFANARPTLPPRRDRSVRHARDHIHPGGRQCAAPEVRREASPPVPLHPAQRLDERPERPGLPRRRVAPLLSAQPRRHELDPRAELGPRRQQGPAPLAAPARCPAADAPAQRRSPAGSWSGSGVVDANNTAGFQTGLGEADRPRLDRDQPRPVHRLQQRPRPDLHQVRAEPRHPDGPAEDPRLGPRPQGLLARADPSLGDGVLHRRQGVRVPLLAGPEALDAEGLFADLWECPDYFELPVDGKPDQKKWVIWDASGKYFIGQFDGKNFTKESGPFLLDYSHNYYAAQTWSNAPDGRRVGIAWLRDGRFPEMPFNGQMGIPFELALRTLPEGVRLTKVPVKEVEGLRYATKEVKDQPLGRNNDLLADLTGDAIDVETEIEPRSVSEIVLRLRGVTIQYVPGLIRCMDRSAPVSLIDGRLKLRVLVDRTSVEIYANDGATSMSMCYLPPDGDTGQAQARALRRPRRGADRLAPRFEAALDLAALSRSGELYFPDGVSNRPGGRTFLPACFVRRVAQVLAGLLGQCLQPLHDLRVLGCDVRRLADVLLQVEQFVADLLLLYCRAGPRARRGRGGCSCGRGGASSCRSAPPAIRGPSRRSTPRAASSRRACPPGAARCPCRRSTRSAGGSAPASLANVGSMSIVMASSRHDRAGGNLARPAGDARLADAAVQGRPLPLAERPGRAGVIAVREPRAVVGGEHAPACSSSRPFFFSAARICADRPVDLLDHVAEQPAAATCP